jgi:hypothetical protein
MGSSVPNRSGPFQYSEWEEKVDYLGDELDLLVFYYLSEGLALSPIDDDGNRARMMLYGNSNELHRYYMANWANPENSAPPPRRILTSWWSSIIDRVESVLLEQRGDIACVLLDLSFAQQQEFERRFKQAMQAVRQKGNDCGKNGVVCYGNDTESVGAIIGFAYSNLDVDERNARALDLVEKVRLEAKVERIVVIGRDVNRRGSTYDFLAFLDPKTLP